MEEDFDQIVMPACLGWDNTIQVPNENFIVSGWGRTNNDAYDRGDIRLSGAHSARLKKLAVPLIPLDQCRDFSIFKGLTENQICAGGKKGTKCLFYISFLNSKNDSYLIIITCQF